ncbi:MAG: extracellular solute-binding protein [Planctomycetota bacterium]
MRRALLVLLVCVVALAAVAGCEKQREVVVYTALDNVFSREILAEFTQQTGIVVKPVFDTEATKTTGLVDRIRREQRAPRCDVFWNNELLRTIRLGNEGLLQPYDSPSRVDIPAQYKDAAGLWTGFAARARVVAYDPERLPQPPPMSLQELTATTWRGQLAIADPRFGTTGSHMAILYAAWGEQRLRQWLQNLRRNDVRVVSGNASSRDRVVSGDVALGWTDTDDVEVVRRKGVAIAELMFQSDGVVVIPNSVAIIRGCPHPVEAQALVDFLLSPEVEGRLAASSSRQIPVRQTVPIPDDGLSLQDLSLLPVDFRQAAAVLPEAIDLAREVLQQ